MKHYLTRETLNNYWTRLSNFSKIPLEEEQQLLKHLGHFPESLTNIL